MSLDQAMLLRALSSGCAKSPRKAMPVRWGTALHDVLHARAFSMADFIEVLDDLGRAGYR